MTYIDVHCHIDRLKNVREVIERARKKGVGIIVTSGIDSRVNRKTLEYVEKFPEVRASLGIYPLETLKMSELVLDNAIKFIKENKDKIVSIGEVGIDMKEGKGLEKQKKNFKKFVKLAIELDKPIIVHSRKAEEDCIEVLEELKAKKVLMHCFSGRKKYYKKIEENDWFVSIPASVKYNSQFQLMAEKMSVHNILCETDSPFLHPNRKENKKDEPNEPANVIEGYKKIAKIKKMKLEKFEKAMEGNYKRLFGE